MTARATGLDRIRGQPGVCTASQSTLLAFVDRLGRIAMAADPPSLDLDENEQAAPAGDQIDLDAIGADVARDNAISSGLEESGGLSFALASEPLTLIRHASQGRGWERFTSWRHRSVTSRT